MFGIDMGIDIPRPPIMLLFGADDRPFPPEPLGGTGTSMIPSSAGAFKSPFPFFFDFASASARLRN